MTLPDIDTLNTYDGAKVNAANVEDATTDRDAAAANQAFASTAGMTHTTPRAFARIVTSATTPTLATSNPWDAVWGQATPTAPTVGRTSAGVFTVTFPTTVADEISQSNVHTVNFRSARAWVEGGAGPYFVQAVASAPNVITVYVWTTAGAANDAAGNTVCVQGF